MKAQSFALRSFVAIVTLVLCAAFCVAQDRDDSDEMEDYANSVKNWEGWKALQVRPPLTAEEQQAAEASSESYFYPGVLRFGVGWSEGLAKIRLNGKVGYIGTDGKLKIEPQFDEGGRFTEGLARVLIGGKWGFIGPTGKLVIQPVFEWACTFHDGRSLVKVGEKWGYIDKTGKIVITPRFENAWSFSEGLAKVQIDKGKYKTGYIDVNGNWVLQPLFDSGTSFHNGRAIIGMDVKYSGANPTFKNTMVVESHVIDRTGRRLFEHTARYTTYYSEGLLLVGDGGFVDRNGREVVPDDFNDAEPFSEGLASAEIDDKRVYIDRKGKIVIRPKADCQGAFVSGRASCEGPDDKYGFIDRSGKFVIAPKYDFVDDFSGPWAPVFVGEKVGYVNRNGRYVWTPTK